MKKIKFTSNENLISKTDIEKENVEELIKNGFHLNEENFKQVLALTSPSIIIESNDKGLKGEIDLGSVLEILSLSSKIRFEKTWFYLTDFITLVRTKKIEITFIL